MKNTTNYIYYSLPKSSAKKESIGSRIVKCLKKCFRRSDKVSADNSYTIDEHNKEFRKIKRRLFFVILSSVTICYSISNLDNISYNNLYLYLLVLIYLLFLICFRGIWFKHIIFLYKKRLMETYYDINNHENDKVRSCDEEQNTVTYRFIFNSNNGNIIGILEGLFYSFALLSRKYEVIPFVVGLRSLLTITSHPNKEESEFFLIGLMGSLLYTVVITAIFIVAFHKLYGASIYEFLKTIY